MFIPSDLIMLHPQDRPRRTLNSEGYPWLAPRAPSAAPHGRRAPRVLAGPAYRRSARVQCPRSAATALVSRIESSSSGKVRLVSSTRRRAYRFGCLSWRARPPGRPESYGTGRCCTGASLRVLLSTTATGLGLRRLCGKQIRLCRAPVALASCKTLGIQLVEQHVRRSPSTAQKSERRV